MANGNSCQRHRVDQVQSDSALYVISIGAFTGVPVIVYAMLRAYSMLLIWRYERYGSMFVIPPTLTCRGDTPFPRLP
jgi:hypothetical protein